MGKVAATQRGIRSGNVGSIKYRRGDRFALTQLEAQAHGLPVIASKFSGKVVDNGLDGIVLEEPTAACIAAAVRDCIADAERLQKLGAELWNPSHQ